MNKKIIIFIVFFLSFLNINTIKVLGAFDCLTLTTSSSQADKDYCRIELVQIEAQLTELLNKQKEQQKNTGTLMGDVNYLTSQINALKNKNKGASTCNCSIKSFY